MIHRFLLPVACSAFVLLTLLVHAHGQSQPGAAAQTSKVRILAVSTPPLADEQLAGGGLVLALIDASLGRAEVGARPQSEVRWTSAALTPQLLTEPLVDLALPVEAADCDRPNELTQASAMLCDNALYSDPILQVVVVLFSLSSGNFKFDTDESILGKTICLARDHELSALNANGRNWAAYKRVTVLRRSTLLDCVAAVQARDADAFAATDLEGAHLLRRLGLTQFYTMQARPLATRGVHAVVSRQHERGPDLIKNLNQGLKLLRKSDAYSGILQKHLMTAAATAAAPGPRAVPPSQPPPQLATPVPDPAQRQSALKYLKRGDEELADGRVAPARLLYERAAEMGLAQAAMALAATYDEVELNRPHLRNVPPDPAEARRWYQRALDLGATDAGKRLQRFSGK